VRSAVIVPRRRCRGQWRATDRRIQWTNRRVIPPWSNAAQWEKELAAQQEHESQALIKRRNQSIER
jgi:hypothetical protein